MRWTPPGAKLAASMTIAMSTRDTPFVKADIVCTPPWVLISRSELAGTSIESDRPGTSMNAPVAGGTAVAFALKSQQSAG